MATSGNNSRPKNGGDEGPESVDESDSTPLPPAPNVNYDPSSQYYDTTGNNHLFIFNHRFNEESVYSPIPMKPRYGTDHDVARLLETFGKHGRFQIDEPCDDYTHSKIIDKLDTIREMDHSQTSCIAIVILTHGEENGTLWASDRTYSINDFLNRILTVPALAGKPKLFFIQACRGGKIDSGLRVEIDGSKRSSTVIPTHSDCLVLRSSCEDYASFRDRKQGSWMIQSLCDVVDKHYNDLHILDLMTLVNAQVAKKITDCVDYPELHEKKQIPETRFTLTKFLKF